MPTPSFQQKKKEHNKRYLKILLAKFLLKSLSIDIKEPLYSKFC